SEPTAKVESRIIHSLRKEFKLAIILEATGFPRSTYMYWQKRFNENNPDEEIEGLIKEIFEEHKGSYGYRRIDTELRNRGHIVKHKIKNIKIKSLKLQSNSTKFINNKVKIVKITKNFINCRFKTMFKFKK